MIERRRKKALQSSSTEENGDSPLEDSGPREVTSRPAIGFEVREGDRLTVLYNSAKLQIAPFSTVELDGAIYSRTLEVGDDPIEQWDQIYLYLKTQALAGAREKLQAFASELAEAKATAGGPAK